MPVSHLPTPSTQTPKLTPCPYDPREAPLRPLSLLPIFPLPLKPLPLKSLNNSRAKTAQNRNYDFTLLPSLPYPLNPFSARPLPQNKKAGSLKTPPESCSLLISLTCFCRCVRSACLCLALATLVRLSRL